MVITVLRLAHLWYRVSTQASPVRAKLKFQPREFPLPGEPGQLGQLGSQPRMEIQNFFQKMDWWPNTAPQASLWELFCVNHLDVSFWLIYASNLLSFSYMLIGRTSYLFINLAYTRGWWSGDIAQDSFLLDLAEIYGSGFLVHRLILIHQPMFWPMHQTDYRCIRITRCIWLWPKHLPWANPQEWTILIIQLLVWLYPTIEPMIKWFLLQML